MELLFLKINVVILLCSAVYSQHKGPDIYYLHIQSDIKFRFATTLVTSRVANRENNSVEAKFEVTLPDAAFITNFTMEIDGRIYPGEINEKEKAKEKYETAKRKGQSAGHVAQKPRHTNRFSVDVNVAPQNKVTFNLTYQELLERVDGEYEHIIYIDPGQVVSDFQIDVSILESKDITKVSVPPLRNDIISETSITEGTNALAFIERPTSKSANIHYAPTVDDQKQQSDQGISGLFVVEYDVERKLDAGEVLVVDGYFVHFFAPEGLDPIPKDVIFILDVSTSMKGTEIKQQRDAMDNILQHLHEGDRFNIMEFSTGVNFWNTNILPATRDNKAKARAYVKGIRASGWTDINEAMLSGIDFLNKIPDGQNRMKILVFLTDGQASTGEQNNDKILQNIEKKNIQKLPVFSLAFGNDADYEFVKKVAVKHNGVARKIFEDSDASLQIKGFYDEISSSTLRNVSFKYLDDTKTISENTTKSNFKTFFDGKELVIAGKLSDDKVKVVKLSVFGNGVDGNIELEMETGIDRNVPELTTTGDFAKITERIWAYLTIKQLLEEAIAEDDPGKKKDLNDRALTLSLKYKFVTPLTSMVVTKPEARDLGTYEENEDASLAVADSSRPNSGGGSVGHYANSPGGSSGRKRGYGGGGGSSGGGGGGDPHFMIRVYGLELPVCFDISAKEGDVMQMLKDPLAGVTINAGIIGSTEKRRNGEFKTFIGELLILAPSVRIHIKPDDIIFDGASVSWDDENEFKMYGIQVKFYRNGNYSRTLTINLGNDIIVEIKRYMKEDTHIDVNYLNMFIEKEDGISDMATGVLGQFVHRKIKLTKVTFDKQGRMRGHFRESGDHGKTHFMTILHKKPDVITGEMNQCWNAYSKVAGLLQQDTKDYFVRSLNTM